MKKDLKQNKKGFCVDEKWHNLCLQVQGFTVLCDKRVKDFERKGTVQNACEEIAENLDFEENNYFIRGSTAAAVRGCSVINSQQNTRDAVLLQ